VILALGRWRLDSWVLDTWSLGLRRRDTVAYQRCTARSVELELGRLAVVVTWQRSSPADT
jgi:hypothetical protein